MALWFCLLIMPATGAWAAAETPAASFRVVSTYGPVKNSDTLLQIARLQKPGEHGATVSQMAWAIYRANPEAFDGAVNRMRNGAMLKIPDHAFAKSTPHGVAIQYVVQGKTPPAEAVAGSSELPVAATAPAPTAEVVAAAPAPSDAPALPAATAVAPVAQPATGSFSASAEGRAILPTLAAAPAAESYARLAALESIYAGDVDFDYALGTTALDSGHHDEAVFALRRAVAVSPGFAGARMDLARAYFVSGDNEAAREEFEILRKDNPPPQAQRVIDDYIDAIDRKSAEYQPQGSAVVELAGGHDTNANGATDARSFGGIDLNVESQAQESAYYGAVIGGTYSYPLNPRWRTVADGRLEHRSFPSASFVDSNQARLGGGLVWHSGPWSIGGIASGAYAELDGEENNTVTALDLTMDRDFADVWRFSLGARSAAVRYAEALDQLDVDSLLGSATLSRRFDGFPVVQLLGTVVAGQDDAVNPSPSDFARDMVGGRISTLVDIGRSRLFYAGVGALYSDYAEFGGAVREDDQYSALIGFDWSDFPARHWGFRTQVTYIDNRSEVGLYDYDRLDTGLMVRREFR